VRALVLQHTHTQQSGHTALPKTVVARRLKVFLEDDLDTLFSRDTCLRLIAHPTRISCDTSVAAPTTVAAATAAAAATATVAAAAAAVVPAKRLSQCTLPPNATLDTVRVVIAVGPEGKIMCYTSLLYSNTY
jgi:hypothetical protein